MNTKQNKHKWPKLRALDRSSLVPDVFFYEDKTKSVNLVKTVCFGFGYGPKTIFMYSNFRVYFAEEVLDCMYDDQLQAGKLLLQAVNY